MFSSLARRLTGWYVVVAVVLVVLLAGSVIVAGLLLYAKDANDQISALARQVPDIEARAASDRDDWEAGQALLLRRLSRPGFTVRAVPPPPGTRGFPGDARYGYFRYSPSGLGGPPRPEGTTAQGFHPHPLPLGLSAPSGVGSGRLPPPGALARPPGGGAVPQAQRTEAPPFVARPGFRAASLLGIRISKQPFMGGFALIFVDSDRVGSIVGISLAVIAATGLLAALVAWAIGRYITSQALRPLYDVTSALVRFAGRDFTAQPIDVAGRSEFDELVRAYNAAADQVATAFAERAAAEAQMRQFVADAGHELRTPLTIVFGYIDLLKRRAPADERTKHIFDTIAIEGSRMRTLIDNLVLLARLEGQDSRPIEPFALTPLLEEDIVQTRAGLTPSVRIELDVRADATIIGERGEIYEAIANLVDNAIKYAPGSPIAVRVAPAAGGIEILVSDRGPGIAAADRELIFDRFYRGSLRVDVEGSGLGLAIAKRAIERAGGTLALAATSESGTSFRIWLRADTIALRPAAPQRAAT